MRHMLLRHCTLLHPSSGDGKPPRTEALPAPSNARKLSWACLSTRSCEGMGRGNLSWSPPGTMGHAFRDMPRSCFATKRRFFSPRVRTPRFHPMRKKLSQVLPMCHGEMDIVSVKELADGSLQFSFGVPTESKGVIDELSSINGEHLATKLKSSSRMPSRFRRQSPIPVMAARRRRKQAGPPIEQGSDGAVRESPEGSSKVLSRPKSSFVKRSPIPSRQDLRSGHAISEARRSSSPIANHIEKPPVSKEQSQEGTDIGKKSDLSEPESQKVKEARSGKKIETSTVSLHPSNGLPDPTKTLGEQPASQHSRPGSKLSQKSPITKVGEQIPQKSSSPKTSSEDSQRQTLLGHADANSQTELTCTEESSTNLNETKDTGKSSEPESLADFPLDFPADSDLRKYTVPELRGFAKSRGLKGYSRLKKEELLDLLEKTGS